MAGALRVVSGGGNIADTNRSNFPVNRGDMAPDQRAAESGGIGEQYRESLDQQQREEGGAGRLFANRNMSDKAEAGDDATLDTITLPDHPNPPQALHGEETALPEEGGSDTQISDLEPVGLSLGLSSPRSSYFEENTRNAATDVTLSVEEGNESEASRDTVDARGAEQDESFQPGESSLIAGEGGLTDHEEAESLRNLALLSDWGGGKKKKSKYPPIPVKTHPAPLVPPPPQKCPFQQPPPPPPTQMPPYHSDKSSIPPPPSPCSMGGNFGGQERYPGFPTGSPYKSAFPSKYPPQPPYGKYEKIPNNMYQSKGNKYPPSFGPSYQKGMKGPQASPPSFYGGNGNNSFPSRPPYGGGDSQQNFASSQSHPPSPSMSSFSSAEASEDRSFSDPHNRRMPEYDNFLHPSSSDLSTHHGYSDSHGYVNNEIQQGGWGGNGGDPSFYNQQYDHQPSYSPPQKLPSYSKYTPPIPQKAY